MNIRLHTVTRFKIFLSTIINFQDSLLNVRSPDEDTDFFDIVAVVLQVYSFALYLFLICQDYVI